VIEVSVVIPAYNAARTLGATLRALRAQIDAPAFELIVVDNGSRDGTADIARDYGALVLTEALRGPAAARNCGLRAARGAIVAHLDADTVPSRRWLCEMCAPFASAHTVVVAGKTLCYPPQTAAERYAAASGLYSAERTIARDEFPFAPSLNMAVRRESALAIGGWSTQLLTGEDVDFSHRLLAAGAREIVYAERAIVYHRNRATDRALRDQAIGYGAGAAQLYRLYPQEVRWNTRKTARLAGLLLSRTAIGVLAQLGAGLRVIDRRQAEFFRYHAFWTRYFWLGFAKRFLSPRWSARR
jgi:glycosyltransferase involved in cell wall biosynthesis